MKKGKFDQPCPHNTTLRHCKDCQKVELKKCEESIAYFYNNYFKTEDMHEKTDEDFEIIKLQMKGMVKEHRSSRSAMKDGLSMHPLMPSECFKKKP